MELNLADIIPYLTERGRVEVDLAIARCANGRQQETIEILRAASGQVDQTVEPVGVVACL